MAWNFEAFSNPFIAREVRTRWRRRGAFLRPLLFTAGLAVWFLAKFRQGAAPTPDGDAGPLLARLGQDFFASFGWSLTLTWALLAPALTAPALAHEREQGLLDLLQLAPMGPVRIVVGKYVAAALYGALVFFCTVPFLAFTLLMGGVAPSDVVHLCALQGGTGLLAGAMGMAASAFSYRTTSALRLAYGTVGMWLMGSYGALLLLHWGFAASARTGVRPWLLTSFARTNPIVTAVELSTSWNSGVSSNWARCLGFELAGTILLLSLAAHGLKRQMAAPEWVDLVPRRGSNGLFSMPSGRATDFFMPSPLGRFSFRNPVLQREINAKFRMRKPPLAVVLGEAALGLLVAYGYLRTIWTGWTDPSSRQIIWIVVWLVVITVVMFSCALMGASGLARERERHTWESLQLALLSPGEIVWGKAIASAISCLPLIPLVLPLLLPCIRFGNPASIPPKDILSPFFVMLGCAWFYTALGLRISLAHRRSAPAALWTVAVALGITIALPLVLGVFNAINGFNSAFIGLTNPFLLVQSSGDIYSHSYDDMYPFSTGVPYLLLCGFSGWLLLDRTVRPLLAKPAITEEAGQIDPVG